MSQNKLLGVLSWRNVTVGDHRFDTCSSDRVRLVNTWAERPLQETARFNKTDRSAECHCRCFIKLQWFDPSWPPYLSHLHMQNSSCRWLQSFLLDSVNSLCFLFAKPGVQVLTVDVVLLLGRHHGDQVSSTHATVLLGRLPALPLGEVLITEALELLPAGFTQLQVWRTGGQRLVGGTAGF